MFSSGGATLAKAPSTLLFPPFSTTLGFEPMHPPVIGVGCATGTRLSGSSWRSELAPVRSFWRGLSGSAAFPHGGCGIAGRLLDGFELDEIGLGWIGTHGFLWIGSGARGFFPEASSYS